MRCLHWIGVLSAMFAAPSLFGQTIGNGQYSVTLDRMGLITKPPADGLTATYGPRVKFLPGMAEMYGLGFDTPSGRVQAVGTSKYPDFARRTPVQFVSSSFTSNSATFVGKVGDLEVEHVVVFDDATPCLVIGVLLHNTGTTPINMVMYTREWQGNAVAGGTFPPDWEADLPKAPKSVWRLCWMPNNILPGETQGCVIALDPELSGLGPAVVDLPLQRWVNGTWPAGVDYGTCWGIAFTDFDHDGFIDVYSNASRNLWQDLGGTDWKIAANLGSYYPSNFEYGSAWADYDDDQLPDFGSEPRGGAMALLHNLGNAVFDNVGNDPAIVDVQPTNASSETLSIADVDGDGDLDWFLPTYPPELGSSGNWFLENEGLDSASGNYTFHEASAEAGVDNPPYPGVNRPEGAEFCDYDYDGDLDLYSNNTIYRNISTPGTPLFEAMKEGGSGVVFSSVLDEGAKFLDYDMDGDMDLVIAFCDFNRGVRMFENNGDGTFTVQPKNLFDSATTGLCLGLSCADWDNDGDVDVTTSEVFRRNRWQEDAARHYTVATHSIPANHITDAVPAWGDFDKDGDLDSALGNWGEKGRLYENYTYNASTPEEARRYVRVRVVRDSPNFDDGLESEYGAQVTVRPLNTADLYRRVRIVSTSGGYLNQDEYVLHFAMPADPDPGNPEVDVKFSVSVDFKGTSSQDFLRVDRHTNPVLGDINLAHVQNREIVVYRSGRVKMDGCDFPTAYPANPLVTTTSGLVLPMIDVMAPPVSPTPGLDWFVGTEISTANAIEPLRLEELIVDGKIDVAVDCGGGVRGNFFVWDVTDPSNPVLAAGGIDELFQRRNFRHFKAIDVTLEPGRIYRVVCRVKEFRGTPISAPVTDGSIVTNGGLFFQDATPCSGAGAVAAALDPTSVYLAVRFRPEPAGAWADLGEALAGTYGDPVLVGTGTLRAGDPTSLTVTNCLENTPIFMIVGYDQECLQMFKGVVVPAFDIILTDQQTDGSGAFSFSDEWPDDIPGGSAFYFQMLIYDLGAAQRFAFSNALVGTAPF